MKKFKSLFAIVSVLSVFVLACSPDKVRPTQGSDAENPSVANGATDPHPRLDTVCSAYDSIFLMSEVGQSLTINKCNIPGGMGPCVTTTQWGIVEIYSGVDFVDGVYNNGDDVEYLIANFTTNGGFYIDRTTSQFGVSGYTFDSNGIPIIDQDWLVSIVNPVVNKYQVRRRIDQMPSRCPQLALNLRVVKLNIFSQVVNNSATSLWGYNPQWNNPQDPAYSPTSQFLTPFCAPNCLPLAQQNICKNVYKGLTCNNGCTTLSPDMNGGSYTYSWSTGATTSSIEVCPSSNTAYNVTVLDGGVPVQNVVFDVNVIDAGCAIGVTNDPRAKFCTSNIDVKYNMSFNIRDYVTMHDGSTPDWNNLRFTYTVVGANSPTSPADWNLTAFNNGDDVTVTSADVATGTGNVGRGQYRVYIYRQGQTTYDAYVTVRVNNNRTSNVTSAKCNGSNCGFIAGVRICHIPPGNPSGATTNCVTYSQLGQYITNYCSPGEPVGSSSNPGDYLGNCGANPCQ